MVASSGRRRAEADDVATGIDHSYTATAGSSPVPGADSGPRSRSSGSPKMPTASKAPMPPMAIPHRAPAAWATMPQRRLPAGVSPWLASEKIAVTRPRMAGSESSWIMAFDVDAVTT